MASFFPPVPRWSQVLQAAKTGLVSKEWDDWFQSVWRAISDTSIEAGRASLDTQSATIPSTAVASALGAGLYRLSYYAQVTQAASVSSSLTLAFQWTYNSVTQTLTGAAMTGNTTTTHQELTFPLRVDQNSSVTYSGVYASSGAPAMQFSLDVALEAIPS